MSALLSVEDLHVAFRDETANRSVNHSANRSVNRSANHSVNLEVLSGIDFEVHAGRSVGLVGESGCGKSVTALSVMRLLPQPAGQITSGRISFEGADLAALPAQAMARLRGRRLAMIFQEPMTALNPVQRVGRQLEELLQLHLPEVGAAERRRSALQLFEQVGISDPLRRLEDYPHQLSGGMRQRVMIAMALALRPALLIADEPTTALDVTIQAQILDLIARLQRESGMALLLITHDLGVVAEVCDEVVVMYAGRIAERASAARFFAAPKHPYSLGLLNSIPRLHGTPKSELPMIGGTVPALNALPHGCRFGNRCPHFAAICEAALPPLLPVHDAPIDDRATADAAATPEHWLACVRAAELPT